MKDFILEPKAIGSRIRELRLKNNKNQNYFADMIYISPSYLSLIEDGKRVPNIEILVQIARFTNVTLDYLILGEEEKASNKSRTFERLCATYSDSDVRQALRIAEFYLRLQHLKDPDEKIEV